MALNPHIFRAYDVRGRVGADINPEVFRQVGRAYASLIRRNGGRRIAVGRDNRESSDGLKTGFVEGVRAAGVDVVDIGTVTTPILYFATAHWKLDGGANITGSHNPVDYNGVKMVHPGARPPPRGRFDPGPARARPAPAPSRGEDRFRREVVAGAGRRHHAARRRSGD